MSKETEAVRGEKGSWERCIFHFIFQLLAVITGSDSSVWPCLSRWLTTQLSPTGLDPDLHSSILPRDPS